MLIILVLLAGFYMAWSIGANDVANAMGTAVGSGALTLKHAVIIAAILEFSGAFFFGSHVSETVQQGIIDPMLFSQTPQLLACGMLSALIGAGAWMQIATYFGWPVSTTHSIVGALVGFGLAVGGLEAIYWENIASIVSSWILSPVLGGMLSFLIFTFLRQAIFYSSNPIGAVKKIAPLLVFLVILTLTLVIILDRLSAESSSYQATSACFALAAVAAAVTYYCVRSLAPSLEQGHSSSAVSELERSLNKAKKHLLRIANSSERQLQQEVYLFLDKLGASIKPQADQQGLSKTHSEYAAVERVFGKLQIMSACMMAFAHGANDVANAIGPLSAAVTLLSGKTIVAMQPVPPWALALGGAGIVTGLATWGWRVIETIGKKITLLTPTRGFSAEFGAAAVVAVASRIGMPISSTHTLVGAVIGVGLARGIGSLDISTMRNILVSWIVTVPAGAILSVFSYLLLVKAFSP